MLTWIKLDWNEVMLHTASLKWISVMSSESDFASNYGGPLPIESLAGKGMTGYVRQYITPYSSNTHFNTMSRSL
jgi:hypothetical protein